MKITLVKTLFYFFTFLLAVIMPGLVWAQDLPPQIIVTFSEDTHIVPAGYVFLLAALGIILVTLLAVRIGKLRGISLFAVVSGLAIVIALLVLPTRLADIDTARTQLTQRTLALVSSPAILQVQEGQNDSILVQNTTGHAIVVQDIRIDNDSANQYSLTSTPATTCTPGVRLEHEASCVMHIAYTSDGGNGGNDGFIDNPQTPDDFINRAQALADGDERIPLSTPKQLEEAFKAQKDPEVIAHNNRLHQNHRLVLGAVDPDPTWHKTGSSTDFIIGEPGSSYVVDLNKIDLQGNDLGALSKTDRARLKFEVRIQQNETTVNYVPSHSHKDYIRWDDSTPGRLHVQVPPDLNQGRLLIGIRPLFKDKGQTAIAERWSTSVVVEIWPKRAGVQTISLNSIYYPTRYSKGIQPRAGSAFSQAEIIAHLQQATIDFPDEGIIKPLVVTGANLAINQLLDARIPRPEGGVYPYSGRVLRVIPGSNGQQLAILNFDLASVYNLLEDDPLVKEGVMPEFVTYRLGSAQQIPGEQGDPELEYFGPEERSGIKTRAIQPASTEKERRESPIGGGIIEGDCEHIGSIALTPRLAIAEPNVNVILEYMLGLAGIKADCSLEVDVSDFLLKKLPLQRLNSLVGANLEATMYIELKSDLEEETNTGVEAYFTAAGNVDINGSSVPKFEIRSLLESANGLKSEPLALNILFGSNLGLKVNLSLDPFESEDFGNLFQLGTLQADVGLNMGHSMQDRNAAAIKQGKSPSKSSTSFKPHGNLSMSAGFSQILNYLGLPTTWETKTNFNAFNIVSEANYSIKKVDDSGAGQGSVSFKELSVNGGLANIFTNRIKGYASLEGSSVYNDSTDDVTYDLDECESRGGVISTPLIACMGRHFCGPVDTNANFCKIAWVSPLIAWAYMDEEASTSGIIGANGAEAVDVSVTGSPLQPEQNSFVVSPASPQEFRVNATCSQRGVTRGKTRLSTGGKVVDEQSNMLICHCKPGSKDCDRVWGDPYMVTADGMAYTYLATGNYILSRVHDAKEQPMHGFEVQANFLPGFGAAWLYSTAMQVGDDVVELRPAILGHGTFSIGLEVMVNGEYLYAPAKNGTGGTWPQTSERLVQLPGGGLLYVDAFVQQYFTYKPRSLTVIWPENGSFDGYAVNVSVLDGQFTAPEPFMELQFTRPQKYAGRERGLLGNNDGDPNNDFIRRNGQILGQATPLSSTALYALFGGDWLVKPRECLFASGCDTEPSFATQPVELTPEQRAVGEVACGGLSGFYKQACINDVGLTGSTELVKDYYANTEDLNAMADQLVTPGVDVPVYTLSSVGSKETGLPGYLGTGFRQAYNVMHYSGGGQFLLTIRPPRGASAFFSEGSAGALKKSFSATGSQDVSVDVQCDTPDSLWSKSGTDWPSAGAVQLWAIDPLSGFASQLLGEKYLSCFTVTGDKNRMAAGSLHSLILDNKDRIWTWGFNRRGMLGDGTNRDRPRPVLTDLTPLGGSTVVSISTGSGASRSQAIDDQGRLWAWGSNFAGVLGDGTSIDRNRPVLVDLSSLGSSKVTAVATGRYHNLMLDDLSRLWAWGHNGDGQLGDGTRTNVAYPLPIQVDLEPLAGSTVTGVWAGDFHSIILDDLGRLWAWGKNQYGELGDGTTTYQTRPVLVDLLPLNGRKVMTVSAGEHHTVALDEQGGLWAWGLNDSGRLGDGSITDRHRPVQVDLTPLDGHKVVAIATSDWNNVALDDLGRLWAWGYNGLGQLGDGTTTNQHRPVQVDLTPLNGRKVVAVSAGSSYFFVVDDHGELWTWGANNYGQLGDGTKTRRLKPVRVDMSAMNNTSRQ
ncbi:VWD domain-containing protein [Serratia rubidaea]|uniref:RCC1 domain-containing protein n=1 Tax=Serratia rubidaea TaxID=61652 RepID=UPI0023AF17CB|nr:VWD domain-containing protein [Serratia rubidaea]MDK1703200.1 VWD domain-containing protein [Serratia rubidaea]